MNVLAIGYGIFILFITSMSNNEFLGSICGIGLILVGSKWFQKRYPQMPFYLVIISFIIFSVLIFKDFTFSYDVEGIELLSIFLLILPFIVLINYHKPKKISKIMNWSWSGGEVDTYAEHMELRYGSVEDGGWDTWIPVALISAPQDKVFNVQFILQPHDEASKLALEAVKRELDFYLLEVGGPDPWSYAQYHCGTMADVYSQVHWSFFKGEVT